ncbi:nestin [Lampris incognitus]|uniref:nestin n=1 Tax=Lampris incognitus TaxID=2546036 RepID=UPI0024B498B6|nr:nestin [Lampris incognitus]
MATATRFDRASAEGRHGERFVLSSKRWSAEAGAEEGSDREDLLQREYEELTNTLSTLKKKAERMRHENKHLQDDVSQTRVENQEYISCLSEQTQKCQSAIKTLIIRDHNHQELETLRKQREVACTKYQEQADGLKKSILEKETKLAVLNIEISQLTDVKSLQQQQLGCLVELEKQLAQMQCQHAESLQALKANFLYEKEKYQSQAKSRVQAEALAANREISRYLQSYARHVSEENRGLREELQRLIQKGSTLRARQSQLQSRRQQLLLEREYVTTLKRL